MQLLQIVWHIWARVNRLIRTALVWKNKPSGLKVLQFCDDYYMEIDNTVFDMSWIANCSFQELMRLFSWEGLSAEMEQMISTLSKLCLTEVEITFMTAQLSFQYAASRFPDTEICDRFQEILANDLHNYYTSQKVQSYAGRLAQMMKLNQGIQKSIRMVRDKVQVARMVDVFILDFSHPEIFVDTGCGA
uniref:NR LBD domain-containing protein n=1 Tax=Caenorhabditis tropicalis TaxID=1561998 RepID=A0A1I7V236_9PELO